MPNLKDIVYCSEEQLETMASGTPIGGHEYNEDDLYITPLGDDIVVGVEGSGTKINENNELIIDQDAIKSIVSDDIQTAQSTAQTAKSAAEVAKTAAETAQSAAQTAQSTAEAAQSTAETAQSAAETAQSAAERAEVIAKGRATAYIYNTIEELETALADEEFVATLVTGDNFYIRALNVPDYWWDGTTKQQLETEKPDLTGLVREEDVQNMINASLAAIGVAEEGSY